jgi:hypothetical protein
VSTGAQYVAAYGVVLFALLYVVVLACAPPAWRAR